MHAVYDRIQALDLSVCSRVNGGTSPRIRGLFRLVSRLGDGWIWLLLGLVLPLVYGRAAVVVELRMLLAGTVGLVLYRLVKSRTRRPRPCRSGCGVVAHAVALDRYSFPSGHTLHAVALTVIVVSAFPFVGLVLVPYTLLVAASRVVLGLHYPSDVLTGATLGVLLAWASCVLI